MLYNPKACAKIGMLSISSFHGKLNHDFDRLAAKKGLRAELKT